MRSGFEFVMSWIMYRLSKRRSNQGQYSCQWNDTIFQNTTCWLYPIHWGDGDVLQCGSSGDWLLMDQSGLQHCHGIDYVTVSLHNRLLPVVTAVQGDFHWKKRRKFPRSRGPRTHCNRGIPQPIFRPANRKRAMPANWSSYSISHWQYYSHQVGTA